MAGPQSSYLMNRIKILARVFFFPEISFFLSLKLEELLVALDKVDS